MENVKFTNRKQWLALVAILAALAMFIGLAGVAGASSNSVTVCVHTSAPAPVSGALIRYDPGDYYHNLGTTGPSGCVTGTLPDGTYSFQAIYGSTSAVQSPISIPGPSEVDFTTTTVTATVKDSDGNPISGVLIRYDPGDYYHNIGYTNASGQASMELFPQASVDFQAVYGSTSAVITQGISGTATAVDFTTTTVTATVKDSHGNPISGVLIRYDPGDYYHNIGYTNASGQASMELFPQASVDFQAVYGSTSAVITQGISGTATAVDFTTTTVTATVKDSDGNPISGALIRYDPGDYYHNIGYTNASGQASMELFPQASVDFQAVYAGTSQIKTQDITGTPDYSTLVNFTASTVTLQFSGSLSYNPGDYYRTFAKPTMSLFAGTYSFKVAKYGYPAETFDLTVPDAGSITKSIYYVRLRDSIGNGVAGGTVHLGVGGWPVIGTTGSDGVLVFLRDGLDGNMKIRVDAPSYGGTQTSPVQDQATNSFYDFQTVQAVIELKDSAGNLTNGGVVHAGFGGWPVIGTTGDDGPGTVTHEMFAGSYNFRMDFNGSTEYLDGQDISTPVVFHTVKAEIDLIDHNGQPLPGGVVQFGIGGWPVIGTTDASGMVTRELFPGTYNFRMNYHYATQQVGQDISTPVVFQTALVVLHFSGTIQHDVGGWPVYSGPLEMLPVAPAFGFSGPGHARELLTFNPTAGTVFEKTIIYTTVDEPGGSGASGVPAVWRNIGGPTTTAPGTTNSNGHLVFAIDDHPTNTNVTVMYGNTTQGLWQNPSTNSFYDFQLVGVTVQLLNHEGTPFGTGSVSFYANGWHAAGNTSDGEISFGMLPGTYTFAMGYNGQSQQKSMAVSGTSTTVTFTTVDVTVELRDHNNDLITTADAGTASNYASGWKSIGTTGTNGFADTEMLPGTYTFAMGYNGQSQQKSMAVSGTSTTVTFNTVDVKVELRDHNGDLITTADAGTASNYASGWKSIGTTGTNGFVDTEMLPGTYTFAMGYNGQSQQKSMAVSGTSTTVTFKTVDVKVELRDHNGDLITTADAGTASNYASGWKSIGTTGTNGFVDTEMLPGTYTFAMSYNGSSEQQSAAVSGVSTTVTFKTGQVHSTGLAATNYYASGWKPFVQDMELLPGNYTFSYTAPHPNTVVTVTAGETTNID